MKKIIFITLFFISFSTFGQIRNDHKLHFLMGSTVGASMLHLPKTKEYNKWQRIYIGTISATLVGMAGEWYDLVSGGAVEGSDILWTGLGGLVVSSLNVLVIEKIPNRRKNKGRK